MMKALIFSGGSFTALPDTIDINEYDLIIGADSGYLNALSAGVTPDIFIGDLDSILEEEIVSSEVLKLHPVKDMTDTQEAMQTAISRGATHITVLGALGNRIDHTIANIHLLKYAKDKGVQAEIIDSDTYITLVTDKLDVPAKSGYCLSLLPLTDCSGVSVSGVFYPLKDAFMPVGNPYGISNEFVETCAHIEVLSGDMLLILCKS